MTEERFAEALHDAIREAGLDDDTDLCAVADVRGFADAGVMTGNVGLVVQLDDGSEWQVTVIQSRFAADH
jgi:hypothetical protein